MRLVRESEVGGDHTHRPCRIHERSFRALDALSTQHRAHAAALLPAKRARERRHTHPSNGYQTWAWGGRPAHGGWATEAVIIQVRPVYAEVPLQAWRSVTDTVVAARDASAITRDSVADQEHAPHAVVGYFPSVGERMRRDERVRLLDSLRRSGLVGLALQSAFERTYGADVDESSIFAHEGRHAIDRTIGLDTVPAATLEYRAKLSEVAFAPRPRLALAGILGATTGDATPHGIANARLERADEEDGGGAEGSCIPANSFNAS